MRRELQVVRRESFIVLQSLVRGFRGGKMTEEGCTQLLVPVGPGSSAQARQQDRSNSSVLPLFVQLRCFSAVLSCFLPLSYHVASAIAISFTQLSNRSPSQQNHDQVA